MTAKELGRKIGQAIARDVLADDMPREWTGLDPQDADLLTSAGLQPGTTEWTKVEDAAEIAYHDTISKS
jgi:hypothetical protein